MTGRLKLTAYFGERSRGAHGFVADELMDLFEAHQVATSVLLRGIAGFGPSHRLRTDATLSLSEDLPVAVIAVDSAERITALADRAVAMMDRGIVTLERTATGPDIPAAAGTIKLSVHAGRRTRDHRTICEVLHRHGFAGAVVYLGVDGTERGSRRRARFFSTNAEVPVLVVGVGDADQAAAAVAEVRRLLPAATVTVERTQVCKRDGRVLARPPALPAHDDTGVPIWQKLTIHTSAADLHHGVPIHRAVVDRLRTRRASGGVTVLRGIWGYHGAHNPHGDKLFALTRRVPVSTVVVGSPAQIAACFDIVDELTTERGLLTCEPVPAVVSIDGGVRRGDTRPAQPPW